METDEKIVKYALDLQGVVLDNQTNSSQILEAFKWLKKHVSGWQGDEDTNNVCENISPNIDISDLKTFMEWKGNQKKDYFSGKFMYDIKGYYKRLDESELFDYWFDRVYSR